MINMMYMENDFFGDDLSKVAPDSNQEWKSFQLKDLEAIRDHLPIKIPTVSEQNAFSLFDMAGGSFR